MHPSASFSMHSFRVSPDPARRLSWLHGLIRGTAVALDTTFDPVSKSYRLAMTATSSIDKYGSSGGLADPVLLEKIDKLFACSVGDYIDLPQLVVVGDQSSGKSSVLEGLTGLPFPRDSGLCTRFATQITFRRTAVESVAVSVIPAKDASTEHVEAIQHWTKTDLQCLDAKAFADIMIEVC